MSKRATQERSLQTNVQSQCDDQRIGLSRSRVGAMENAAAAGCGELRSDARTNSATCVRQSHGLKRKSLWFFQEDK